ncbi:hypothetical protein CUC15_04355 [Oceanobacillus zhaokaii]|uniref:Uncharacterized protein n=1 Tax=Oceanobacillus zhaokaii TaxID=2052660 RepID=A0A345PE12_9BACI|nr:hypothetical protein [Oceanobacillus zhaokaii]AXI08242.1 hypothetical protein CUC15_04355 [Oceanobacillus zhaokaii]
MAEKNSLNEETLNFIIDFEKEVPYGKQYSNKELVELFRKSTFHKLIFDTYIKNAINKSIWYAVKRSGKWALIKKGIYTKE